MPTMQLTRTTRFSAAHRYWRPEWSPERNREVFGPCSNPHGHGHDYRLEVTVRGEVDPETGFCFNLAELDRILREEVVEPLDHQHLNHTVEAFREGGRIPTTENLLLYIRDRLGTRVGEGRLVKMRLYEAEGLWVEWPGG